jgi:hypothetical protein
MQQEHQRPPVPSMTVRDVIGSVSSLCRNPLRTHRPARRGHLPAPSRQPHRLASQARNTIRCTVPRISCSGAVALLGQTQLPYLGAGHRPHEPGISVAWVRPAMAHRVQLARRISAVSACARASIQPVLSTTKLGNRASRTISPASTTPMFLNVNPPVVRLARTHAAHRHIGVGPTTGGPGSWV